MTVSDPRKADLNLLVILDALLAERNLTRAGERVGMSQPAVSGALTRLRAIYGDQLLVREGRGFELTPRARSLEPIVAECMAQVSRTFDVLPEFDPATSERAFVVAASDYALGEITGPLLRLLDRHAPRTRVEFTSLHVGAPVTPVDLLRWDVCIVSTGRGVPGERSSLFSDTFVCIVDAENPALVDGELTLDALADLRHVRSVLGPNVATHIDDMLGDAGLVLRPAAQVQGFLSVPYAVAGTPWVGWVPERIAHRYADSLGLAIARTPLAPRVLVEAAHWHPSKAQDQALHWLVGQLRAASVLVEFGDEDVAAIEPGAAAAG